MEFCCIDICKSTKTKNKITPLTSCESRPDQLERKDSLNIQKKKETRRKRINSDENPF